MRRRPLGDRIQDGLTNALRSWPSVWFYTLWTAWWWSGGWPVAQLVPIARFDPFPFAYWVTIVTFFTQLDVMVYGARQRRQDERIDQMMTAQSETMQTVLVLANAIHDLLQKRDEERNRRMEGLLRLIAFEVDRIVAATPGVGARKREER